MKVGLSYSRCVRDIFDGKVDIGDVLVIIARTNFDPRDDTQWKNIWNGYRSRDSLSFPEWENYSDSDEHEFRAISVGLYESGKIHQPRQFEFGTVSRSSYIWLEVAPTGADIERNPALKAAWEQFQIVAGLAGVKTFNDEF